jgi:hypothetical protein
MHLFGIQELLITIILPLESSFEKSVVTHFVKKLSISLNLNFHNYINTSSYILE